MKKRLLRFMLFGITGLMILCIAIVSLSALSNLFLPTHSQVTDHLSTLEKARLAEAIHLRQTLGDKVWPGWGSQDIPVIVHNEEYAFIVGYPDPPAGWAKMPQRETRGGPWESVPDDTFQGKVYYRQRLADPKITPENFTVLVGDRWVATMQTYEYGEIFLYREFSTNLPGVLRPLFPYRLAWWLLMGETENYIGALEHETFHAFQGTRVASRLAEAETANRNESQYPWGNPALEDGWKNEQSLLVSAVRSESDAEAAEYARQFLAQRDARRIAAKLDPKLVDYEQQREWLEGLAKYTELSIGRVAGTTSSYAAIPEMKVDSAFKDYTTRELYWSGQIDEVGRTAMREGETRFYYSGMAQAVVLDRLLPGWKERAFNRDVMLEDLLREAIAHP